MLLDSKVPESSSSSSLLTQCSTKAFPSSTGQPRGGRGAMSTQTKIKTQGETTDYISHLSASPQVHCLHPRPHTLCCTSIGRPYFACPLLGLWCPSCKCRDCSLFFSFQDFPPHFLFQWILGWFSLLWQLAALYKIKGMCHPEQRQGVRGEQSLSFFLTQHVIAIWPWMSHSSFPVFTFSYLRWVVIIPAPSDYCED